MAVSILLTGCEATNDDLTKAPVTHQVMTTETDVVESGPHQAASMVESDDFDDKGMAEQVVVLVLGAAIPYYVPHLLNTG